MSTNTEVVNSVNNNLINAGNNELIVPNNLTEKQKVDFEEKAKQSVAILIKVGGDIFSDEADNITNVGLRDQQVVSNGIQLMQENLGRIFYSKDKTSVAENMSKDISQLQSALAKIHPKYIGRESKYQLIQKIPFLGNYIMNMIKETSSKAMTLKEFTDDLTESLKQGEINLKQDNAQLKVINADLKKSQLVVEANAYYAELLIKEINEQIKVVSDVATKNNLNKILARVSSRLQNIRTTENVIQQFVSSITLHKDNYDSLLDSAREMQSNGVMVVNVSMIIHAALTRAKNVKDLLVDIGEFEGKMLLANATLLNKMVTEIGEMRKNPFIPMKYMESSILQLEESIDKTNKINLEVIESSKNNSGKIKVWTEDLKIKVGDLPDVEVKSLEASDVLMLDKGKN